MDNSVVYNIQTYITIAHKTHKMNDFSIDTNKKPQDIEAKALWKKVLAELQLDLSDLNYKTWFSKTSAENLTDSSIDIICASKYVKDKVETRFFNLVNDSLKRHSKKDLRINLIIRDTLPEPTVEKAKMGPLFTVEANQERNEAKSKEVAYRAGLSPKLVFENYLMGRNNQLAYAIATAVAANPGKTYNPVFFYSGVGLGKTHLMQAIGNKILEDNPNIRIVYCTGESFTNELIESIQSGKGKGKYTANQFRDKYRKADVLLIDDIQFIAGREATQEEFFHTFNALYMAQKQIVLTSDRPPKDFTHIEERITSRFSSGIIADLQTPDFDMRIAILRQRRDDNKDEISNDVLDFIAEKINTNVRELEGAYMQVLTFAKATGAPINIESAAQALGQSIKTEPTKQVNVNQIIKAVCNYYSVKTLDLKGKSRNKEVVIPRQVSMYLMYKMIGTPYMTIGELLGGRDHTTIMHGVKKIEEEYTEASKLRQDIMNIKQSISTS